MHAINYKGLVQTKKDLKEKINTYKKYHSEEYQKYLEMKEKIVLTQKEFKELSDNFVLYNEYQKYILLKNNYDNSMLIEYLEQNKDKYNFYRKERYLELERIMENNKVKITIDLLQKEIKEIEENNKLIDQYDSIILNINKIDNYLIYKEKENIVKIILDHKCYLNSKIKEINKVIEETTQYNYIIKENIKKVEDINDRIKRQIELNVAYNEQTYKIEDIIKKEQDKIKELNFILEMKEMYSRILTEYNNRYREERLFPYLQNEINKILNMICDFTIKLNRPDKNIGVKLYIDIIKNKKKYLVSNLSGYETLCLKYATKIVMMEKNVLVRFNQMFIDEGLDVVHRSNINRMISHLKYKASTGNGYYIISQNETFLDEYTKEYRLNYGDRLDIFSKNA
jgi:hypothetical protein